MAMAGSVAPCGACKFLRRKCVKGCVFAPHFCHEQGAAHFAAIHKVFGASNASKILAHLPVSDRSEAAVAISYEAQARLQDPIYGCVSHIFALQHQVVNLQVQLASLKEQAAECIRNSFNNTTTNPNYQKISHSCPQDVQSWLQNQLAAQNQPFDANSENYVDGWMSLSPSGKYENPISSSFGSMNSVEELPRQYWQFQNDI